MSTELVERIAAKVAELPVERQREALAFVESLVSTEGSKTPQGFRSVKGILHSSLETLEKDLADARQEMWRNFPREEPK